MDGENAVEVIGHDHPFIEFNVGIVFRDRPPTISGDISDPRSAQEWIVENIADDSPEVRLFVACAYGDEVHPVGCVIPITKTDGAGSVFSSVFFRIHVRNS